MQSVVDPKFLLLGRGGKGSTANCSNWHLFCEVLVFVLYVCVLNQLLADKKFDVEQPRNLT